MAHVMNAQKFDQWSIDSKGKEVDKSRLEGHYIRLGLLRNFSS